MISRGWTASWTMRMSSVWSVCLETSYNNRLIRASRRDGAGRPIATGRGDAGGVGQMGRGDGAALRGEGRERMDDVQRAEPEQEQHAGKDRREQHPHGRGDQAGGPGGEDRRVRVVGTANGCDQGDAGDDQGARQTRPLPLGDLPRLQRQPGPVEPTDSRVQRDAGGSRAADQAVAGRGRLRFRGGALRAVGNRLDRVFARQMERAAHAVRPRPRRRVVGLLDLGLDLPEGFHRALRAAEDQSRQLAHQSKDRLLYRPERGVGVQRRAGARAELSADGCGNGQGN